MPAGAVPAGSLPGPPEPPGRPEPPGPPEPPERPGNYGIYRVELLDGNVGYIDLRAVAHPAEAGPVIAAAMELVAGTYALIIDLRRNRGGSPDGAAFWCSYLFPGAGTHLNDIFHAGTGETRQFWSLAYLPGARYLDRPVYLLSSHETFSGGEDICYTLQAQGRAQVIGEVTGGGAHPTRPVPLSPTMAISVPFARSVNPVTGTNWEGTGVLPDVAVPAAEAYDIAYGQALRHVLSIPVPPPVEAEARAALASHRPEPGAEMRRIVCREFGPPDRLVIEDAPDPRPGPGEVLVGVRAAGVSFVDGLIVGGAYQLKPPLPFTPGLTVAGQVLAAGDGVPGWPAAAG